MIKIINSIKLEIIGILIYLLLFIIPIITYLKFKEKVNPIAALKLSNKPIRNILKAVLISLVYILLLTIKNEFTDRKPINLNIGIMWVSVFLVGTFEEIPFRGFLLQKLWKKINFVQANIVTTLLFVLIHIPEWIYSGADIIKSSFTVSIVSLVLGYLFKEYDSLWIPIVCHSIFNFTTWIGLK
ncbi:CPBP family intramembrane glutamic endopeptidase [Clostridium sp. WILCCON 0202]|uniref:CPBP family intramembrane glutamic endopeptidase n=1 Tax=Candidatus Clostridium radicumherbarum TaxID=3381662 RepID=A0ABW8TWN6_9CLOT